MASARRHIEYEHWATLESVKALQAAGEDFPMAVSIVAHLVGISELWRSRVEGVAARFGAWPELTIAEAVEALTELRRRWLGFCDAHEAEAEIGYTSNSGEACVNTFGEVVQELLLHGAHHRGQIALLLRRGGHEPPKSTDFIPALRRQQF